VATTTPIAANGACSPTGSRRIVEQFVRGYSSRGGSADVLVANDERFRWFSAPDRIQAAAGNRTTLGTYLGARARAGIRDAIVVFHYNGTSSSASPPYGNFDFVLQRSIGATGTSVIGKGALACSDGKIIVWSEGRPS